jgi:hypothetical protein
MNIFFFEIYHAEEVFNVKGGGTLETRHPLYSPWLFKTVIAVSVVFLISSSTDRFDQQSPKFE